MTSEREPVDDAALLSPFKPGVCYFPASDTIECLLADETGVYEHVDNCFSIIRNADRSKIIGVAIYGGIKKAVEPSLAREGWQPPAPEPDRAEVLAKELWENGSGPSLKDWETIIRRHLSELRAEWEAERPVIDVPKDVVLWAHAQKDAKTGNAYVADFILQLARQSQ